MTTIDKAALHILDAAGSSLLSAAQLPLTGETSEYLLAHIEKSRKSSDKKAGTFYENSECKKEIVAYLAGEEDFLAFSRALAESFLRAFSHAAEAASMLLFVLEVHEDERRATASTATPSSSCPSLSWNADRRLRRARL